MRHFVAGCFLIGIGATASGYVQAQDPPLVSLDVPALESAEALLRAGQIQQAHDTLYVSFQNSRANGGFYQAEQIPILENILASSLLLGEWDEFLRRAEYLESLAYRIHGNSAASWQVMQRLSLWHLAAAALIADERSVWHLIEARNLLWQTVSRIEAAAGPQDPRLSPMLYQILLTHYYMAYGTQRRGITSYALRTDEPVFLSGWAQESSEMRRKNYDVGLELLHRIRAIEATADPARAAESGALLQLHLADWHLLFGHEDTALDAYRATHAALLAAGWTQERANSLFGTTVILPATQLTQSGSPAGPLTFTAWSAAFPGMQPPPGYPLLRFARSLRSIPLRVDLIAAIEGDFLVRLETSYPAEGVPAAGAPSSLDADLASLRLRPVLRDGRPVSSLDVPILYEYVAPEP